MADPDPELPADADVSPFDVAVPLRRERLWDLLLVIAAGGAIGGGLRHLVNVIVPPGRDGFPWSTFTENVVGSFAIGVLMVYLLEVWRPNRYLRPFLGVGVLGGFTTFSSFALDTRALLADSDYAVAGLYLVGSIAAGLTAAYLGIRTGRFLGRTT